MNDKYHNPKMHHINPHKQNNKCIVPDAVQNGSGLSLVKQAVDINDILGNFRFRVQFIRKEVVDEILHEVHYYYTVIVDNYTKAEPVIVYNVTFNDATTATKKFNELVAWYKSLVDAEFKDIQDIRVYADKINYRLLNNDCCATCKFSRKTKCNGCTKFECHNPKTFVGYSNLSELHDAIDIHPEIKPYGICDNFQRCK